MKFLIVLLFLVSCSDALKGSFNALGKGRDIKCYSGGVLIYEGKTTGKIENESNSDGYFFTDTNGKYIETNSQCVFVAL